jgi:hypothetical protein
LNISEILFEDCFFEEVEIFSLKEVSSGYFRNLSILFSRVKNSVIFSGSGLFVRWENLFWDFE